MKIAVCDDSSSDRNAIRNCILSYGAKNYYSFEVDVFESGEEFLESFAPNKYQIVFLDIYMKGITGIRTAEIIRGSDQNVIIIFSTISIDHALDSYSVQALYYVVKPVDEEKITTALNLCRSEFIRSSTFIEVMSNKQIEKVLLKDIFYIEVYGKTSIIHTTTRQIKTYVPLEELFKLLGGEPFMRCHRSYIVNLDYVTDILENDFVLTSGEKVPIRKTGRAEAKIALAKNMTK